jgi:hypothetical protein
VAVIHDPKALAEIRRSWQGLEALRGQLQRSAFASVGVIGGTFPHKLADAAHNLPFIHAHGVLNDVLRQLAVEGVISCRSIFLGKLVGAARTKLAWRDLKLIRAGIRKRNAVAHKAKLLPRGECWKHVDAISREFKAWGIIS